MEQMWSAIYQETYLHGSSGIDKAHSHANMHQIIYVTEGECEVCIADKTYQAKEGSFIVINHIEKHHVNIISRPYKRYIVYISVPILQQLQTYNELISLFNCRTPDFQHCVDMSEIDGLLRGHLDRLVKESQSMKNDDTSYVSEAVSGILLLLLIDVFRVNPHFFPSPQKLIYTSIYPIKQYIDTHYVEDITLDGLAAQFHISKSYLCQNFKKMTGNSPKQYLLLCRIAAAKSLLHNTDMLISEITHEVGFTDINNFIRYFKADMNMTPLQFRKNMRGI